MGPHSSTVPSGEQQGKGQGRQSTRGKKTNIERQNQEVLQLLQNAEQPQVEHSLIESAI